MNNKNLLSVSLVKTLMWAVSEPYRTRLTQNQKAFHRSSASLKNWLRIPQAHSAITEALNVRKYYASGS